VIVFVAVACGALPAVVLFGAGGVVVVLPPTELVPPGVPAATAGEDAVDGCGVLVR
jgi:hypothetical protein